MSDVESDIRIAIWNAGMKGGMGQDLSSAFIDRAMSEPTMQRALSACNEALEALEKCRLKFRYYEHCHRLKCTPEGDEKADRNREMADMCAAATKGSGQ